MIRAFAAVGSLRRPVARLAPSRSGVGQRWFSRRSAVARSPALRDITATGAAPAGDNDSDFVDIDYLAVGVVRGSPAPERAASALASFTGESTGGPLGVTRRAPDKEGAEFSRFGLPLDTPRDGKPVKRADSRAALEPGEEAEVVAQEARQRHLAASRGVSPGEQPRVDASSTSEVVGDPMSAESVALALTDALREDASGATGPYSAMPQVDTSMPYDDEEFAETILQMEVDGAIDEVWQDSRKAHLEDVKEIKEILVSLKVRDICCVDVSSKTGNFDYVIFGTCEGPRHIHLAAWAAQEADSLKRVSKVPRRKTDELWEVVPVGRIVLNLMVESLRSELSLERKWTVTKTMDPLQAANAPVSEGRNVRAHGLWTLTVNLQDLEDFEVDYCKDVLMQQL